MVIFHFSSLKIDSFLNEFDYGSSQLVELQVFASPRITLRPLVPTLPCFANIVVSLMDEV